VAVASISLAFWLFTTHGLALPPSEPLLQFNVRHSLRDSRSFMSGAILSHAVSSSWPRTAAGDGDEIQCGTCFCDVPRKEATAMECGHAFCDDCWQQHLTIQITDGNAKRLPCMGVKCGVICDETKVSTGSRTQNTVTTSTHMLQRLCRACPCSASAQQ